jgi:uncharacterized protein
MKLEQSFDVPAPIDRVWQALIDVEHVAPCLPGAAVTGRGEDGSYEGAFSVKIGPTSASYTGKLEMTEVDASAHTATMQASGTDKRGQGGASATIVSRLTEAGEGTHVEVVTDYKITGRLARFGRGGMIEDISERLLKQFASRLAASLTGGDAAAADAAEAGAAAEPAAAEAGAAAQPAAEAGAAAQPAAEAGAAAQPADEAGAAAQPADEDATEPAAPATGGSDGVAPVDAAAAAAGSPPPSARAAPASEPEQLDVLGLVAPVIAEHAARRRVPIGIATLLSLLLMLRRRRRRRRAARRAAS